MCARQFGRLGPTWHAWHAPCEGAQVVLDKRITIPEVETKLDELQVQVQSCEDELRQELTFEVDDSDSDSDLSVQSAPPFLVPH